MTIAIGNDHAGTEYKFEIIKHLETKGHLVLNFGTDTNNSMDYPDAIHPTANAVENGKAVLGIILCGSGNGAQMTANKHQGIRAALCWNNELQCKYSYNSCTFCFFTTSYWFCRYFSKHSV